MPRQTICASLFVSALALTGCVGGGGDLDFDFRANPIAAASVQTAPRPEPDANGLITYETYQVVAARRGDTVADVALRIGLTPQELASHNGRNATDILREREILALPRRVGTVAGGTDIAAIALGAIDQAEAGQSPVATAPRVQPGVEPVQHRVGRGETAYSVARLYGVSVRVLAEWNGLGPDLAVREGQFLLIPIVLESGTPLQRQTGDFGGTIAPPPPSAATPLPAAIETAPLPPATGGGPVAPTPTAPTTQAPTSQLAMPVNGSILRDYSAGNEGIDIGAPAGTSVRAAADGVVAAITQDTDQISIILVRHDGGLLTVYANISNIQVARGDSVTRGQTLAEVSGGDPSFLRFEVRRGMEAVDPNRFLP